MYGISTRRWYGGLVGLASILSRAAAQSDGVIREITTTTAGGRLQDGVMFDVEVIVGYGNSTAVDPTAGVPNGITVMGMGILTPSEDSVCVEIYSKSGSHEGFESDSAAWTFLGSVSVVGQGRDTLTPIPVGSFDFGDATFVPVGGKRSFYVTTQDQSMRYTAYPDGSQPTGSLFISQTIPLGITTSERSVASELNVNIYTGVATDYAFGATWKDRMFNGRLLYTLGSDTSNVPVDPAAEAASLGKSTCDEAVVSTADSTLSQPPTDEDSTLKALATILAGGFLQAANMFDVSVPSVEQGGPEGGVTVLSMEMSTSSTEEICVEVYSKKGTYVGSEENASDWTMLGAVTTTGQGAGVSTRLPLGTLDPVHIAPGERRGFYVAMPEPVMRYTQPVQGEKAGDVFTSNNEIQIHVGSVNGFGFEGYQSNRIWNGAIIYSVGVQEDGKFSQLTADDRPRSCHVPGVAGDDSATDADADTDAVSDATPDAGVDTDVGTTTNTDAAATDSETDVDTTTDVDADTTTDVDTDTAADSHEATATVDPGTDEVTDSVIDENDTSLSGYCDAASSNSAGVSKEVILNYKYAMITDDEASTNGAVSRMEEEIHEVMIIAMCAVGGTTRRKLRRLQLQEAASETFIGFKSAPEDVVSSEGCPNTTTIPEGRVCSVVHGGVTAVVSNDANETEVKESLSSVLQQVLSNAAVAADIGVVGTSYISSGEQGGTEDQVPAAEEEQFSTGGDAVVAKVEGSTNTNAEDAALSTTQIIIIAAVCGCALLVVLLSMVLARRKRSKRADEKALFNEFPNEGYGDIQNLAFRKSDDPLDDFPRNTHSWGSSEGIETAKFAWQDAAVILNEQDEISIISSDRSKHAPSAFFPLSSGNSVSSRSSSRKNVEFIKAGRSFASNRSSQPEDTVDL